MATGIFLGLFWPRDPTWKVTKLQVDAGELGKLVTAVSGGSAELVTWRFCSQSRTESGKLECRSSYTCNQ